MAAEQIAEDAIVQFQIPCDGLDPEALLPGFHLGQGVAGIMFEAR
jgi:hypothetical protein